MNKSVRRSKLPKSDKFKRESKEANKSMEVQETLLDGRIQLHPACVMLPGLSEAEIDNLEADLITEHGEVKLRQPILIDHQGRIVDGRHRAKVLIRHGYGDYLADQIEECKIAAAAGEDSYEPWVELLDEMSDPFVTAIRLQAGRRNLPQYLLARCLLASYQQAVHASPRGRKRKADAHREENAVKKFCESVKIDKRIFQMAQKIENTDPKLWDEVVANKISFEQAYAKTSGRDSKRKTRKRHEAAGPWVDEEDDGLLNKSYTLRSFLNGEIRTQFCVDMFALGFVDVASDLASKLSNQGIDME